MSQKTEEKPSVATKIQQAYWEAKRNFINSLGNRDDDCLLANDLDLDTRIEFLQAADHNFNTLLEVLLKYNKALANLMATEEALASALIEYGIKDSTRAGKLMSACGKSVNRGANRKFSLKTLIMKLFHEVQTFQFKATVDVLQTVAKMEKSRKSYRAGLMWMKNESQTLDPDVSKKLLKFKKVQEHIRNLKVRFDRSKLEVMQKIDLYLFSRCNLFSQTLVQYRKTFCKVSKNSAISTKYAMQNIPYCFSYKFEVLTELNDFSNMPKVCLEYQFNSAQNYKNVPKIYTKLGPDSNPDTRNRKDGSPESKHVPSQPGIRKKVTFQDQVSSDTANRKPNDNHADQLIILTDEEENQTSSNVSSCTPENDQLSRKYSDDLLSLELSANQSTINFQGIGDYNEFRNELENCMNLLDFVGDQAPQTNNSELQFWSLMENFKNVSDNSPLPPNCGFNQNENSKNSTFSYLENILNEFDPFCGEKTSCFQSKVVNENC
ncbi:islet cell autoantigen 1 [Trichonephila clavata]|uniref:Islet cell autoantigen 1 n=1 Tax=Trichonephila clavata TaxID=2740835 RepID=A0A8X6L818_TRICU|nr:islet cell autoantigen 1 [Trichonephila clavata]